MTFFWRFQQFYTNDKTLLEWTRSSNDSHIFIKFRIVFFSLFQLLIKILALLKTFITLKKSVAIIILLDSIIILDFIALVQNFDE